MTDNSSYKPSLIVKVHFTPGNTDPNQDFSYEMVSGNHGWAVDNSGNITTPPSKRVIRFDLHAEVDARVFGLRFALKESEFPKNANKEPWFNHSGLQAFVPMTSNLKESVSFVLDHQLTNILYQFGVQHSGGIVWDDPRIYSDGSI
jgi:hypothetical protein